MTTLAITQTRPVQQRAASAIEAMASRLQVDPSKLFQSLAATVFKGASNEEMLGLVVVANQYRLNPFLKQIYAFPKKGGGIVPIVGIDGWAAIVNSEEKFDGCEFLYEDDDDGHPRSCTCIIHVKGRGHPIKVTEYFAECKRSTDPWNGMPRRMLRHKAFMQAGRLAFGLGGIYDEDEAHDIAGGVMSMAGDDNSLTAGPARAADRGASIVDRLKNQETPAATGPAEKTAPGEAGSPSEASAAPVVPAQGVAESASPGPAADGTPTWADLAKLDIVPLKEDEGITVQSAKTGMTLTPQGTFSTDYNGYTVQPNNDEQDLLARQMAAKAVAAKAAPARKSNRPNSNN